MRRKIELYIGTEKADLSDQSFVLFNYAQTDVMKPTAVKNSFTKQVTLPASPANDAIFGCFFRTDRSTSGIESTGTSFSAGRKTPFTIYDDLGQIIETGYVRLDEVTRKGRLVTGYKVTLFGGIGSLFYALSYTQEGEKMTLADLTYISTQNPPAELDFIINETNVTAAWTRLRNAGTSVAQKWDVVNFMPAYEGLPDGDFDADKGYGIWYQLGLTIPTGYNADSNSGVLVKFAEKVDGWAAKDLRSYLQRPVVSVKAMLRGMVRKAAESGITLDYSAIPTNDYAFLWKTLPAIPSIGTFRNESGLVTATLSSTATTAEKVADWALSGLTSFNGVKVSASLVYRLRWNTSEYLENRYFNKGTEKISLVFVQVLAYATNTLVGCSDVLLIGPDTVNIDPAVAASFLGYTPVRQPEAYHYFGTQPVRPQSGQYAVDGDIVMNIKATGVTRYELHVVAYAAGGYFSGDNVYFASAEGGNTSTPKLWTAGGTELQLTSAFATDGDEDYTVVAYSRPNAPRSGAALGKATLLSTSHTPAEYLVSLAKTLGWVFLYNPAKKKVAIMRRDSFFSTPYETIDLTDRIDTGAGITISPVNHGAKWYNFALDVAEGAFAAEYKSIYGVDFGVQRIDTGYDFDAADVNLVEGNAFRGAASILDSGKYWNICKDGSDFRPSMFIFAGNVYTLKKTADGSTEDFNVPTLPSSTTITYYNDDFAGFDLAGISRLELRDAEGKGVAGEDILVRYNGQKKMPYVKVTDDSAGMLEANGQRPCWSLAYGSADGVFVPNFSRFVQSSGSITQSLDFGVPREVNIPGVDFADGCALYSRRWAAYMRDLLDKDTKVMKARVNLEGLKVDQSLLRRFFWYDGSIWVLNKITNYSLTTFDTAECEFIQVRDKSNYTNGQNA